jgi:hypothetical protein
MMNRIDNSGQGIARLGRDEDNYLAHVAAGEMVVPPVITPETRQRLEREMMQVGLDPNEYTVGGEMSINPITGNPEFGFFKKVAKSLKKVVKKIAPVAAVIPGPWQGPAIAYNRGKAVVNIAKGEGGIGDLVTAFTPSKAFKGGKTGNIFGNIKEFVTKGKDGVGLFGNLGSGIGSLKDRAGEFIFKGDDGVGLFGNIGKGFQGGFQDAKEYILPGEDGKGLFKNLMGGQQETLTQEEFDALSPTEQQLYLLQQQQAQTSGGILGGKSPIEFLSSKLLPQGLEDALGTGPGGTFLSSGDSKSGGLGNLGIAGLAGLVGKLAYEEAKKNKGVPLTPLTTMDQLGRYNIAAEIARQKGEAMPSRVEYGLTGEGMPVLEGGKPRQAAMGGAIYNQADGDHNGIMAFAEGGVVEMKDGGKPPINPADFPPKDGQIDGPGTETSDDIPAMLSDGEFVMTAKAVKGAGSFDMNTNNGIVTLTPNGDPSRDGGTRVMYKLMEHFGSMA